MLFFVNEKINKCEIYTSYYRNIMVIYECDAGERKDERFRLCKIMKASLCWRHDSKKKREIYRVKRSICFWQVKVKIKGKLESGFDSKDKC